MKELNAVNVVCYEQKYTRYVSFKNIYVTILLFASLPFSAWANICSDLLENKPDLIQTLHKAAKDDYAVQLMTTMVDGKQKLVVLLGETHIKSPTSAAVGREVLETFDYVGGEGYNRESTWGGKFSSKVISPIFEKVGIKNRPQFWFARLIEKFFGGRGLTEGSTITESEVAEFRNQMTEQMKKMPANELADLISILEEISDDKRDGTLRFEGVSVFSLREMSKIAKAAANGIELPKPKGPKETIHLEAGHTPDIWENIDSIEHYVTIGAFMGYYAAFSFLPQDVSEGISLGISAFSMYQIGGMALRSRFEATRWYQRIFPLSLGKLKARNGTMVNNIATTIESRSDVEELLVIVGKAHVPEMKRLLEQRGYSSLALPDPEQMEAQDKIDLRLP